MCRVYEKCGYHHEGTARQKVGRGGHWHDAEFYGILESDELARGSSRGEGSAPNASQSSATTRR